MHTSLKVILTGAVLFAGSVGLVLCGVLVESADNVLLIGFPALGIAVLICTAGGIIFLSKRCHPDTLHKDRARVMSKRFLVIDLFILILLILAALFVQRVFMGMFEGLGDGGSLPMVTRIVCSLAPWKYAVFSLVFAGALIGKEFAFHQPRKKLHVNVMALYLGCFWTLIYGWALFGPLFQLG